MDKKLIPDTLWVKIAKASRLPNEARARVNERINSYGEMAPRHVASDETRKAIQRSIEKTEELSHNLKMLEQDQNYLRFGRYLDSVDVTELTEARARLDILRERLLSDQNRFKRRSHRDWSVYEARALVTDLLEMRTDLLQVNVPTTHSDTTRAGAFLDYVKMCVRFADPELNERQIDRAIDSALTGFHERRSFEPENFPSVPESGVKKKV